MGHVIEREQQAETSRRDRRKGDDLTSARAFTDAAAIIMDDLMSEKRLEPDFTQKQIQKLQDGAATMSARAVHIAASQVLDLIDVKAPQARIDGQLVCLFNLLQQYQKGLDEIAGSPDAQVPEKLYECDQQAFDTAKTVLEPLLGLTQTRNQYDALSFLAGLTPRFSGKDAVSAEIYQSIEMAVPAFTQAVLSSAHHLGRTVSVSYDVNGSSLISSHMEGLRTVLKTLGQALVQHVIQSRRLGSGFAGHGHVSLYAEAEGSEAVVFTLTCQGQALPISVMSALRQDIHRHGANDVDICYAGAEQQVQIRFVMENQPAHIRDIQTESTNVEPLTGELAI